MSNDSKHDDNALLLGFTTVETREDAEKLARASVESGFVACAQADAPITSFFSWEGKQETVTEHRVLFKFVSARRREVEEWLHANHPYDTPEWIVIVADHTAEKYLQWARETTS